MSHQFMTADARNDAGRRLVSGMLRQLFAAGLSIGGLSGAVMPNRGPKSPILQLQPRNQRQRRREDRRSGVHSATKRRNK